MADHPQTTKKSHKKKRRKVSDLPHPSTTTQEQLGSNEDSSPPVITNMVTQASPNSQYNHHDADAAGALLTLSSSPGRVPPPPPDTTPFNFLVNSIVGASATPSLPSGLQSDEQSSRAIQTLYSLGLRNRDVVPATGNAPGLLFGCQVSPPSKRQRVIESVLPSRRLNFNSSGQGQLSNSDVQSTTTNRATATATGTANFVRLNNQDRITSDNSDRVLVALRRLPIPAYPSKQKRPVPAPLLSVQPASLPLEIDYTKQSCCNLIRRIRNPLSIKVAKRGPLPPGLNDRQASALASKSKPILEVPQTLPSVMSFALRTLLIEDILHINVGTPVIVFFLASKTKAASLDDKWKKAHAATQQRLPNVKGIGAGVVYHQVHGYVIANPKKDEILGRPISDISEMITNVFQKEGILVRCPPGSVSEGTSFDLKLTYHELFFYPSRIFLQAELPYKSQWRSALAAQSREVRKLLMHRYVQEAGVDRVLIADAVREWRFVESADANQAQEQRIKELQAELDKLRKQVVPRVPNLMTESVKTVCEHIDTFVDGIGEQCFGQFSCVHERILTLVDMQTLITFVKRLVPTIWDHYMDYFGYSQRMKRDKRNCRLLRQYEKNVFWRFFLDCRQSNNKLLVKLAIIMAAASYVRGDGSLSVQTMVFFGITVSKATLLNQLSKWAEGIEGHMANALAKLNFFIIVFDNLQQGLALRYMFGGSSNFFTKLTASFHLEPYLMILPLGHESFKCKPLLTYLFQVIPAAYGLPAFEKLSFLFRSSLPVTMDSNNSCPIDSFAKLFASVATEGTTVLPHDVAVDPFNPTGERTRAYITAVRMASLLSEQFRFFSTTRKKDETLDYCHQPAVFANSELRKLVNTKLNSLRNTTGLYHNASRFQSTVTKSWRGSPPPARILLNLISTLDETSKLGASTLLVQFMVQARLIQKDVSTGMFDLCDGWENQTLALVGDGLTLDRVNQFFEDIREITDGTISSFKDAYRQSLVLAQALTRVIPIPGDLHTRFHQLDAVFRTFWGGFLQPICWRLGWKKVKGKDVPASYSHCHLLAAFTYRCVVRLLLDVHVHSSFDIDIVAEQSAETVAIDMATTFHDFAKDKAANSKDWVLRLMCQYVLRMFDYLLMVESERIGDSLVVEDCYVRFLPLLSYTGKRNYFELTLSQMEWHYLIPANLLHQVRINRMRRQTGGKNQDGKPTPNSAMDLHIERMMPVLKAIRHRNTAESWVQVSKCIPFCMKCRKFTDAEMSRRKLLDFIEAEEAVAAGLVPPPGTDIADPTHANKTTTVPNAKKNLVLITEGLVLAGMADEIANRRFDDMHFWKAFNATKTEIKETRRTAEAEAGEQRLRDVSHVEAEVGEIVTNIFDGVAAAREKNRSENDGVTNDGIGDIDNKSLYDDEEAIPWIDDDCMDGAATTNTNMDDDIIATVNESNENEAEEDNDIDVPESLLDWDESATYANDDKDEENNNTSTCNDDGAVDDNPEELDGGRDRDEAAEEIRKKVNMKIEPMDKTAATTDYYNNEVVRLKEENIVSLRRQRRERAGRSNEFLKKQLYERLIGMEQTGVISPEEMVESTRMEGNKLWRQYLENRE